MLLCPHQYWLYALPSAWSCHHKQSIRFHHSGFLGCRPRLCTSESEIRIYLILLESFTSKHRKFKENFCTSDNTKIKSIRCRVVTWNIGPVAWRATLPTDYVVLCDMVFTCSRRPFCGIHHETSRTVTQCNDGKSVGFSEVWWPADAFHVNHVVAEDKRHIIEVGEVEMFMHFRSEQQFFSHDRRTW